MNWKFIDNGRVEGGWTWQQWLFDSSIELITWARRFVNTAVQWTEDENTSHLDC